MPFWKGAPVPNRSPVRVLPLVAALCVGCLTATAVAVQPGWTYAAANCGFPQTNGPAGCARCCRDALAAQAITANELNGCLSFCNTAQFPRRPNLRRFQEALAKVIVNLW
jgi:hypothetical protein